MKQRAFTLLETIIVLAIMTMFFAISIPLFSKFTERAKLDTTARSVASALRTARSYAISKPGNYYVFFDASATPPHTYYISNTEAGTNIIEKEYKLPVGIYFDYDASWGIPNGPIGFTKGTHATKSAACFKSTGELDEISSDTAVYVADDINNANANWKRITVERTTGRTKID